MKALKLAPAPRRPEHLPSDRQQNITANFSLIARTWRTLTESQRDGFCAFGQTWSPNPQKSTISGFLAFQS